MTRKRVLHIDNLTRGTRVVEHGCIADSFWTRLKGLMGVRRLAPGDGLLITPAQQIHTHFMAITIDVLYVDENNQVIDMDVALKPWQVGRFRQRARTIIEIPSGMLAATHSACGDQLKIVLKA
jgi:hypothetical protein